MTFLRLLFCSSLGKKYLMAGTGLALFGFVVVHMIGNLQIYLGPDVLNGYAALLKGKPALLWGFRLGLFACVALHIYCAITLSLDNKRAQGPRVAARKAPSASYAARTMPWSGLIVLAFILYHLAHFTLGWVDRDYLKMKDDAGRHDVHAMVVAGFQHPLVSGFYLVAMTLLCMHLRHGLAALCQSLGLRCKGSEKGIDRLALIAAAVILIGNSSIPAAVLFGWIR